MTTDNSLVVWHMHGRPTQFHFDYGGAQFAQFGSYICFVCGVAYTVNKPGSWDRCTSDYCHDCCKMEMPA